jgi:hypothetical protein
MRSRILVTAFLVFAFAGASTLVARGIAGACATGCCAADAACCAQAGACDKARCAESNGKGGCCDAGGCAMGCCDGTMQHHAQISSSATGRQWSVVNFHNTVRVNKAFITGPVLIVHDDAKMARGEPCTTFYRFVPGSGPREELVSFHCKPRRAAAVATTTVTGVTVDGVKQLTEYQLAGDEEAHGIPR